MTKADIVNEISKNTFFSQIKNLNPYCFASANIVLIFYFSATYIILFL